MDDFIECNYIHNYGYIYNYTYLQDSIYQTERVKYIQVDNVINGEGVANVEYEYPLKLWNQIEWF